MSNPIEKTETTYEVRDVSLAAFLKMQDIEPIAIQTQDNGFGLFVYERSESFTAAIKSYFNYKAMVDARTFCEARSDMKRRHTLGF